MKLGKHEARSPVMLGTSLWRPTDPKGQQLLDSFTFVNFWLFVTFDRWLSLAVEGGIQIGKDTGLRYQPKDGIVHS